METLPILERLYRLPARKLKRPRPLRWFVRRALAKIQRYTTGLAIASVGLAVWIASHIYYYNMLIDLESNVTTARAQVEVAQQRRNHIQRNLTQLLRYYARYERDVLKDVTGMRTEKKPEPKTAGADALARLDAVAEQYPNLQLNNTVQQMSESIVNSETNVAARTAEYNDAVNIYTNVLHQFPGNIFGKILGFQSYDYFETDDRSVLEYREVQP